MLKKYLGLGDRERSHAGEDLSRCRPAGGRRHRQPGGAVQSVLGISITWQPRHDFGRRLWRRPEDRLAALLLLVTINYAKLIGEEKTRGSIEPGKLADFAVLTDDFLTVKPETIRDESAPTWVGGREVYRDPAMK